MKWEMTTNGLFFKDNQGKIVESMINMSDIDFKYLEYLQERYNLTDLEVYQEMQKLFCRLEIKRMCIKALRGELKGENDE